ncbi:sulfotransferase domain-containing protein [Cyanobacterium sp. DS4]|uniref:sulfotransferase domain-containing protein n=1 Tax=Cyanobacterium sp. DS4 TaxID=2878255 RepID=UPI002E81A3E3|nr:sulfotransferase domain-containing protein [Cyanobacterium sp. Dongsha4]WVK99937.1 sulfotransferase domain-containing protein [Cyanobacterium sp. Dongsha4]
MKLPNLIIGGAPKCATSSIFNWLVDHPDVCGSNPKETFFLMDQDHPLCIPNNNYHDCGLKGYEKYFHNASKNYICDATTHYLYQQTAVKILSELPSIPNVIFVLRKPSQRVYSSYQFTRNNRARLNENLTFSEYVKLIQTKTLEEFRMYCNHMGSSYVLYNDINYSCYVNYLKKWIDVFPSQNLHILLFEDLIQDPRRFMKSLCHKIGIYSDFYDSYSFEHKNKTYRVKNLSLHRQVQNLSRFVPSTFKELARNVYISIQTTQTNSKQKDEDKQTLTELDSYFEPFNRELAKCFNLNLSSWE